MPPLSASCPPFESSASLRKFLPKLSRRFLAPINSNQYFKEGRWHYQAPKIQRTLTHSQFFPNPPTIQINHIHLAPLLTDPGSHLHVLIPQIPMTKARVVHSLHGRPDLLKQPHQEIRWSMLLINFLQLITHTLQTFQVFRNVITLHQTTALPTLKIPKRRRSPHLMLLQKTSSSKRARRL